MSKNHPISTLPGRRTNKLAGCVAAILGLASPATFANSVFVTNCNDAGAGSLRGAVSAAADSDNVDMTGLTTASPGCSASTITLRTGDILVPQNNLSISGPGMTKLTVTGKYGSFPTSTIEPYRIFTHTGTGTLELGSFSMSKGYETTSSAALAEGGCVYSSGTVILDQVGIYLCKAHSSAGSAVGGGIYAKNGILAKYSVLSNNIAEGASGYAAYGGGIFAAGGLSLKYSTVSGNSVSAISGTIQGLGGGIVADGDSYILNSTISENTASSVVGGLALLGATTGSTEKIVNSTITGNSATASFVGGAYVKGAAIGIYNSTIAFNQAGVASGYSAGLVLKGTTIDLESNLVANNTYGSSNLNDDLSVSSGTVTGHKNLVRISSASLPSDTITGQCPILGSLRFNGGSTQTLALQSKSPGIDKGNNVFVHNSTTGVNEDQRGGVLDHSPYPYPRVSGLAADIGAYEIQQADIVFTSNLEGCT